MSHDEHANYNEKENPSMSMYTNPALPITVGAGDFHDRGHGFEPADAALVQSNNLATILAQVSQNNLMLNESISRNSKENAILAMQNQIGMAELKATIAAGVGQNNQPNRSLLDDVILLSLINRLIPTPTP